MIQKLSLSSVYEVISTQAVADFQCAIKLDWMAPEIEKGNNFYYNLTPLSEFNDLKERLVIDWGKSALSWHQWLHKNDKEVFEILPSGSINEFPGYLNFILSFKELEKLIQNPIANRTWHDMLSAVFGIYLILDKKTGKQYIGSAPGVSGILGRWETYVQTGHGNNVQLISLINKNPDYKYNFSFSLLQTLPKTVTPLEVLEIESLYKEKLGTRKFKYNSN